LLWDVSYTIFDAVGGFRRAAMFGQDAFMFWR